MIFKYKNALQSLVLSACFLVPIVKGAPNDANQIDLPGQGEAQGTRAPAAKGTEAHFQWLLQRALEPVEVNTDPLPQYDYDKLDYALSEGITITPGGRLWAAWVAGGDNDKAFVVLASSDDKGETWSKPRAVLDPREADTAFGRRALVTNLWTDPQGRLWLFYDQASGYFDGRAGVWATVCDNPDAEHPRWSTPQRIADGAALNKPIATTSGEWLLPVSLWPRHLITSAYRDSFKELDPIRRANVIASTDQGKTWSLRGGVLLDTPARTVDENTLIERKDGSLWMLARSTAGMWQSVSTDGGHTWSAPEPAQIAHSNARHFITRLDSGRLLLVKHGEQIDEHVGNPALNRDNPSLGYRNRLSAFLSDDDGKTWTDGLLLVPDTASYPDGVQAQDGTIYICYDRDRWYKGEIWMARFTEADILAGELSSPQSAVDLLVSRAEGLTEAVQKERRELFREVRKRRQAAQAKRQAAAKQQQAAQE